MRPVLLLLTATALLSSGCAACIARMGTDPGHAHSREEVHEMFGQPAAVEGADDHLHEDFCYHGKVAENLQAAVLALCSLETLGLMDIYLFPYEIGRAGWNTLWGYDLRFYYNDTGKVTNYTINGTPGMDWPFDGMLKRSPGAAAPPPDHDRIEGGQQGQVK